MRESFMIARMRSLVQPPPKPSTGVGPAVLVEGAGDAQVAAIDSTRPASSGRRTVTAKTSRADEADDQPTSREVAAWRAFGR
jgi:hypothetical protein